MEHNQDTISLTALEISHLWTAYQSDTLTICATRFFLVHAEDPNVRELLEHMLELAEKRKKVEVAFFDGEHYPVPHGFTDQDVNFDAPQLFSDNLYLEYVLGMTKLSMTSFSTSLSLAARTDMVDFFAENLRDVADLHKKVKIIAKKKGLYIRAPRIPVPNQIDYVKKDSFLSGWAGEKRPLLGVEIANLFSDATRNALGQAVITGFSQVADQEDVRKYFEKGRDIAGKHYETFSSILRENYLSDGMLVTPEVKTSTVSPFSDKLMVNFVTTLISSGISQYGTALSSSPRHDLAAQYTKLMAQIGKYANEGANLLIDSGWMEQPPIAADREDLAKR